MANTLGILVTSDQHLNYVVNLAETAYNKGKKVKIFFTGRAVKLMEAAEFCRLNRKASLAVCDWSSRDMGLTDRMSKIYPGIFETQAKHAEIMKNCDRYVVF